MSGFRDWLKDLPLIAVLRGLTPDEAEAAVDAVARAGWRIVEIPLNSPDALTTLGRMVRRASERLLVGAGTVITADQANRVADAGARLMVAPNCDGAVIRAARSRGLYAVPGVATPSEAFAALAAGADALKLFPAEMLPPEAVKAWRAVIPQDTVLLPVGGIGSGTMAPYLKAGADGFGIGSSLYRPGDSPDTVHARAVTLAAAYRAAVSAQAAS